MTDLPKHNGVSLGEYLKRLVAKHGSSVKDTDEFKALAEYYNYTHGPEYLRKLLREELAKGEG